MSKRKTISVAFWYTKIRTLYVTRFFMKFLSWHLYTKIMTLCVTWCSYIQKSRHVAKRKIICVTFLYTKILTLCVTRFSIEFLKLEEGGAFSFAKNNELCVKFYIQKTMHFALRFLYKNPYTICYIFICKKQCTLRYVFISEIYCIVLIPIYKRMHNQSDQIEK